jgi:hypothetical protein
VLFGTRIDGRELRQRQRLRGLAEVFQHGQRPQAADVLAGFAVGGFRRFVGAGFDPGGGVVLARKGLAALDVPSPLRVFPSGRPAARRAGAGAEHTA